MTTTATTDEPIRDMTGRPVATAKPRLGKRLSWADLWAMRPDLKPDNQNDHKKDAA
ncbi:hypothetical protein [Mesorhizobium sp. A623]